MRVSHGVTEGERLRVIAAGMSALILTVGLARFAYTPMLPVMRAQVGLSAMAGGWLATVNYAGYILGALIASAMGDLRQKYTFYRFGLITALVTTIAMGMTEEPLLWAFLRFLSGVSSTAGLLLASGLALNWLIRNGHTPRLGLHFAGMGVGVALSGLGAMAMANRLSWDAQWIVFGLIGLFFFLPAWFWLPRPDAAPPKSAANAAAPANRLWLLLVTLAYFCAGFGYVISATFIVAIVDHVPQLSGMGNAVWILVGLAAIPSSFLWDRAAAAWGQVPAMIAAFALQIVSILLPALSNGMAANLVAALLYGGTFVGIVNLMLSLIGRLFPANPARAMARLTLSYGLAQIAAPAIAGILAAQTGDYRQTLFIAAAVMGLGIVLLLVMGRNPPA